VRWEAAGIAFTIFRVRPTHSLEELSASLEARGTETPRERGISNSATARARDAAHVASTTTSSSYHSDTRAGDRDLKAIITAERMRVCPRTVTL